MDFNLLDVIMHGIKPSTFVIPYMAKNLRGMVFMIVCSIANILCRIVYRQ